METMFNQAHVKELMNRIDNLNPSLQPQWGKMNVAQMLAHCSAFQDIAMGNSFPPRGWLGILIGRFVKPMFYNAKPPARNMSTIPSIIIADDRDFEVEKETLKGKIVQLQKDGPAKITPHPHPFFGKLTAEQWGIGLYKHLDHHLKQFGV